MLQTFTDYKAATNDIAFAVFLVRAHEDYEALNPAEKMSFGLFPEQGVHILSNFRGAIIMISISAGFGLDAILQSRKTGDSDGCASL